MPRSSLLSKSLIILSRFASYKGCYSITIAYNIGGHILIFINYIGYFLIVSFFNVFFFLIIILFLFR